MSAHVIPTAAVLIGSALLTAALLRGLTPLEARVGWLSWAAHWVSSFALYWLMTEYYRGNSDVFTFFLHGETLSAYLRVDPHGAWGRVLRLIAQRPVTFPFPMRGVGLSTGTMEGLAGVLLHVLGSKWAAGGVMASVSFSGKVALLRFLRARVAPEVRPLAAVATLLVPSVIFWTSGLVKEAVAIFGLGWALFGLGYARDRGWRAPLGITLAVVGVWIVSLAKSYLLIALGASVGVWLTWRPPQAVGAPSAIRVLAAVAVAGLAIVLVGEVFPRYSFEQIGDEIAEMQERGGRAGGGSYLEIGDPTARSTSEQLLFAPAGLVSALLRPFLFEVRNATMAVNALETTALLVLIVSVLWRMRLRAIWSMLRSNDILMMSVSFVAINALGVGLSTTNLGTLSRYRVPMMPFYVLALLMAYTSAKTARRAPRGTRPIRPM